MSKKRTRSDKQRAERRRTASVLQESSILSSTISKHSNGPIIENKPSENSQEAISIQYFKKDVLKTFFATLIMLAFLFGLWVESSSQTGGFIPFF